MSSYLITGANASSRLEIATQMIGNKSTGPDLIILEESNSINEIRDIKSQLTRKPFQSNRISVVLSEANELTVEAQNALLKTLEEPPGNTDIYLLIKNPFTLLPTILSRTQIVDIGPSITTLTQNQLLKVWKLYTSAKIISMFEDDTELGVEVWAEFGRQLLLYKINPGIDLGSPKLTDFATIEEINKMIDNITDVKLVGFLRMAQQVSQDIKMNINRKLAYENLILSLV